MIETRVAPVQGAAKQATSIDPFVHAFNYVLLNEGILRTDDPRDRGGLTKFGITQQTLSFYLGHEASPQDVDALDVEAAQKIYRELFWLPLGCDALASVRPATATALFDAAVLCGQSRAVSMAQASVGVKVDGGLGPLSRAALIGASQQSFMYAFVDALVQRFVGICLADPTQTAFLRGWCKRALRHLQLLL